MTLRFKTFASIVFGLGISVFAFYFFRTQIKSNFSRSTASEKSIVKKIFSMRDVFYKSKMNKSFFSSEFLESGPPENYSECALEMCGQPKRFFNLDESDELERNLKSQDEADFDKLVHNLIQSNIDLVQFEVSQVRRLLNLKKTFDLTLTSKIIVLGNEYSALFADFIGAYLPSESGNDFVLLRSHPQKFLKNLDPGKVDSVLRSLGLNANDKIWFKNLLNAGLFLDKKISLFQMMELDIKSLIKILKPGVEHDVALNGLIAEMNSFSDQVQESIGLVGADISLFFTNAKLLQKDSKAEISENDLALEIVMYTFVKDYFKEPIKSLLLSRDFAWDVYLHDLLSDFLALEDNLNNSRVLRELRASNLESCSWVYKKTLDQANSSLRIKKFNSYISEMIDLTKKSIRFSSARLQTQFETRISDLNMNVGRDLRQVNSILKSSLRNAADKNLKLFNLVSSNPDVLLQLAVIKSESYLSNRFIPQNLTEDEIINLKVSQLESVFLISSESLCKSYYQDAGSDHLVFHSGLSRISWSSVRFPSFGVGIAAHELGHFVSEILKEMGAENQGQFYFGLPESIPLWQKRECLNRLSLAAFDGQQLIDLQGSNQTNISSVDVKSSKEAVTTEEDWADLFSSHIIKLLKAKHTWLDNFGCVLLDKDDKLGYYTYLGHGQESLPFNDEANSSHSSPFKRSLMIHKFGFDRTSKSCEKVIQDNKLFQCL